MKAFLKKHELKLAIGGGIACFAVFFGMLGFACWQFSLPKFQDVTIELGQPMPALEAFLTEHADPEKVSMVTLESELDLTKFGELAVTLDHHGARETVKLTVADTTAPQITLQDLVRDIRYVPDPADFVAESFDLSETTLSFAKEIPAPENYGDTAVEVVITDAAGNTASATATLSYVWLIDQFTLEYGDTLEKADVLMDPQKDADLLPQEQLDAVNAGGVGTYTLTSTDKGQVNTCTVTVVDTTGPELEVQDVERYVGGRSVKLEDFLVSATDLSGEVTTALLTEPSMKKVSNQTIQIQATDIYGNTTVKEATLHIVADTSSPNFSGVSSLTVEKHSKPDFAEGVTAYDTKDGNVEFTYDASKVDTSKPGTYYVTYKAVDSSGNTTTHRRKVTVNHDAEDTAALVAKMAEKCDSDAESIRDFVREYISYSTNWGGDDPVWYGFKNRSGNCYVHAKCLQDMLEYRGYSTKLIWVTDKSHYWVLVYIDGHWRHIDATPGVRHTKYSLMTDEQRHETLQGRDWDRDNWPEAV
ncbi:MAG: transglutaminase domain-containing protein [Oscillospiraceae bacterium]|nr:transglutaminase domain-containing protein [Oscillospiraceae bacterium]